MRQTAVVLNVEKMKQETENEIELYSRLFEVSHQLIGQTIEEVHFYLETANKDFTEQPNDYGKSLLNGIDLKTSDLTFSIGIGLQILGMDCGLTLEKRLILNIFKNLSDLFVSIQIF